MFQEWLKSAEISWPFFTFKECEGRPTAQLYLPKERKLTCQPNIVNRLITSASSKLHSLNPYKMYCQSKGHIFYPISCWIQLWFSSPKPLFIQCHTTFFCRPQICLPFLICLPPHKHPGRYLNTGCEYIFHTQRDILSWDNRLASDTMNVLSYLFDRVKIKLSMFQLVKSL